ncbi:MAG: YqhA family protein [Ilumatobacteraceae bacterium]
MSMRPLHALLSRSRYLVLTAVVGLSMMSAATFVWAIAKSVKLIGVLLDGGWRGDNALVDLLGVIDVHLLAIVQLIVAIGLYELFIGDLDVPDWLEVASIDDLKKSIVDVLIIFIGVKGIEGILEAKRPLDSLMFAAAAATMIGALALFSLVRGSKSRPGAPKA